MMMRWVGGIGFAFAMIVGCGEDFKPPPKDDAPVTRQQKTEGAPPKMEQPFDAAPPAPEPTTPEEIELARKAALVDGRAEDAVKYCSLEGVENMEQQSLLGCVLAACRTKDAEKSRAWGKSLVGALKKEAIKVCHSNGMGL